MNRLRVQEVIVVEGKYDATTLATQIDGLIITTDGFSIFTNNEKIELLRKLGKQRGLIILTDSDAAGFRIRNYIEKKVQGCSIKNAYVPGIKGKESRKAVPSKEGTLGVEGLPPQVIRKALLNAGVSEQPARKSRKITYTDLYFLGLSGTNESAEKRRMLLKKIGLPVRLSKRALCQVLNSLYTYEEFEKVLQPKPTLFWDFHGTLTLPEITWFTVALEAAAEQVPEKCLKSEILVEHFSKTCLPWFTFPSGDTKHLKPKGAWWKHCENEFIKMFVKCGFSVQQAKKIVPEIRAKILQVHRYHLYEQVIPTLETLQKRGYISYIISNNFPELEQIVEELGLLPYFEKVFVSARIGYDKPHPNIFRYAQRQAGNPEDCWMIGDNKIDDAKGAKQVGFTTVLVNQQQTAQCQEADYMIPSIEKIVEILQ